jgi:hypothetical protein
MKETGKQKLITYEEHLTGRAKIKKDMTRQVHFSKKQSIRRAGMSISPCSKGLLVVTEHCVDFSFADKCQSTTAWCAELRCTPRKLRFSRLDEDLRAFGLGTRHRKKS